MFLISRIYVCAFWIKFYVLHTTESVHSLAQYCGILVSVQFHTYFIYCSGVIDWIFFSFCCCINSLSASYMHKQDKRKTDHFSWILWAKQVLNKYCFKYQLVPYRYRTQLNNHYYSFLKTVALLFSIGRRTLRTWMDRGKAGLGISVENILSPAGFTEYPQTALFYNLPGIPKGYGNQNEVPGGTCLEPKGM